jgi:hypothetical protein
MRFVLTSVPSVPHLEATLLFHREPALRRRVAEVARALYLPDRVVADLLQALCHSRILACEDELYWYAPAEALVESVNRLEQAYRENLVGVTNLIHDATQKSAIRFADAFRWRKDS